MRQGTAADLDAAVLLLAESFAEDPICRWQVPDQERRALALPGFFRLFVEAAVREGGLLVTEDLSAVRIFAPPGPVADGFDPSVLRALLGPDTDRTQDILRTLADHHPDDRPHYHLVFSAVRPHLRCRGLGTATLRHVLDLADRDGIGVYVESSTTRSRKLVLRHGFEALPPIRLPDGGPSLYPSWREPSGPPQARA
ncbi:GNAT family N-acetyltransferase [Streptomyces clavuligerus]|uniref:GNAT family N-acetyltransferase n=1 Tax=Streptomyces clavuligerus TaxID=1901 RepID=UPI00017FFC01|nr:GNAT family N-acetyltransferase [Streptomyces clavuligerus]EDY49642.1 acetyltransferase [Streptomyces clavuligerus]MBY6307444.1 GNAT family N-acetyltransferase [Streptomyces clavuligerus]QCS09995.1 N-acetyltransferase [Streptomyces clavuligerus]QPJ97961.1 GNAT family N-acetyltransferase [Streptomyces clavuligerus]WDN56701.1 GNAT family N-acetyltransferase [Streptomyces clavuligerus]